MYTRDQLEELAAIMWGVSQSPSVPKRIREEAAKANNALEWCAERMRVTDAQIREVIDELKSRANWSVEDADEFCREQAHKLTRAALESMFKGDDDGTTR